VEAGVLRAMARLEAKRGRFPEARALLDQGEAEEARLLTMAAEAAAEPDIPEQFLWRKARARVLAAQGAGEEAERLAREAVDLAARTDHLEEQADTLLALAEVLRRAGRPAEAATAVRQAVGLYEQKGNTVLAGRAREALPDAGAG
jgi:tetratricopeptide (TPR) repeat protein